MTEYDPTAVEPAAEGPPKPDTEPVEPVTDDEMATLEQEGGQDVAFMPGEEAEADDTVDNRENDFPVPESPNDPTDDIVVEGDGVEPDAPINPVEQEQPTEDPDMDPPDNVSSESLEADPNDDGITGE